MQILLKFAPRRLTRNAVLPVVVDRKRLEMSGPGPDVPSVDFSADPKRICILKEIKFGLLFGNQFRDALLHFLVNDMSQIGSFAQTALLGGVESFRKCRKPDARVVKLRKNIFLWKLP